MKYRVELGRKIWKKNAEKPTFWAKFEHMVLVQVMLCFPVSTSFRIPDITCSFIIRFELFKWIIKIDFK